MAQWAGLLSGPILWLVLLQTNYILAYVACEQRQSWFMHVTTAVALALVASGGYAAWRASVGPLSEGEPMTDPLSDETGLQRSRWLSLAAVASSLWFIVVILSMEVPLLVLEECR